MMRTLPALFLSGAMLGCFQPQSCLEVFCDDGFVCSEESGAPECVSACGNGVIDFGEACDASAGLSVGRNEFCDDACSLQVGVGCADGAPDSDAFCLDEGRTVATESSQALIADFDQDGDPDIIRDFVVGGVNRVSVLLNDGQGAFPVSSQEIAIDGSPRDVADLTNDGLLDILLLTQDSAGNRFVVPVIQGPQNTLTAAPAIQASGFLDGLTQRPGELGDLNNDGNLDLLSVLTDGSIGVFLGDGQGGFSSPVVVPEVGTLDLFGFGLLRDWDSDGDLDWIGRNLSSGLVVVVQNQGNGTLVAGPTVVDLTTLGGSFAKLDAQDWDNDGDPDLMVGTFNGGLALLQNNAGSFVAREILTGPSDLSNGAVGDFNGDGFFDLAIVFGAELLGNESRAVSIFENDGAGQLTETFTRNLDASGSIRSKDFNGDGLSDILFLNAGAVDIVQLSGNFAPQLIEGGGFQEQYADFNGDGFLDRLDTFVSLAIEDGGDD